MNVLCGVFAIASIFLVSTSANDFICPDEGQSLYPHPTHCAKFLECNNGILAEHDCITGTLWNSERGFCDLADNVECVDKESYQPVGECPVEDGEFPVHLADSEDCTIFYKCLEGVPYEHSCPEGLHFNPTLEVCDYPSEAGCLVN